MGKTEKGYNRLSCRVKEYEHRLVARIAWGPRVSWNVHFHVHHMDGCRSHNCRQNLLILPPCLHFAKSNRDKKALRATYKANKLAVIGPAAPQDARSEAL